MHGAPIAEPEHLEFDMARLGDQAFEVDRAVAE
jgi:hypothetical protein